MLKKRVLFSVVILVAGLLFTFSAVAEEWVDDLGLITVFGAGDEFYIRFNLERWDELYGLEKISMNYRGVPDLKFQEGPVIVRDLQGDVQDVYITASRKYNLHMDLTYPLSTVFFLLTDGTVQWSWGHILETIDWGHGWYELETPAIDPLPFLNPIDAFWSDGETPYGIDASGVKQDLLIPFNFDYLVQGSWYTQLTPYDGYAGLGGFLTLYPSGGIEFKIGLVDENGILFGETEIWGGEASFIIAEGEEYPPNTLLADLDLYWTIVVGVDVEGDSDFSPYQAAYSVEFPAPDQLRLTLLEGRSFYPGIVGSDPVQYTFHFRFEQSEESFQSLEMLDYSDLQAILDFLDREDSVNALDNNERTLLMVAAVRGAELDVIEANLKAGIDVNALDNGDNSALIWASWNGREPEIIKALIAAGADVNQVDAEGYTSLMWILANNPELESVQALLEAGADPNLRGSWEDNYSLPIAFRSVCSTEIILALIAAGADVNAVSSQYAHPLFNALWLDYGAEVVEALLAAGADPHVDSFNETPLMHAVGSPQKDQVTIIKILLAEGVNINARDNYGQTALHWAASSSEDPEVLHLLIEAGAHLDVRSIHGETPLMYATRNVHPEMVGILLEAGADGSLKDLDDKSAFDHAQENEFLINTPEYWLLNESRF